MCKFVSALASMLLITSAAAAGPKEEALLVLENWSKAFSASDVDGIVQLYAPNALFIGTGSKTVVTETAGVRSYFEDALLRNPPIRAQLASYETMVLSDTVVIVTGLDALTGVREGIPFSSNGRVTFIVAKRGADWKIVHFHRSAMPK